jgi:GPH family glycoside/pentoside/hexuronide:cation symporter
MLLNSGLSRMMLPFHKKVAYGMGRFGSSFLLTLTGLTSFYIYGTVFRLNWFLDGVAVATSFVVIGLTHWFTGYYSDNIETRWGRRKPFIVIGAPGLAITGLLLFVPNWFIDTGNPALELTIFGYYLLFLCAFRFFYGLLLTPFQAWLPEITDEDERPLVSSMQNTANWVANGLGVVVSFLTTLFFVESPTPGLTSLGFTIVLSFAIITVLFYLPSIALIREKPDIVIPRRSIREETRIVLKNPTYVRWMLIVGFLSFGLSAITAQVVGYAENALLLTSFETLLPPALALLVSLMVFLYLWIKAIQKSGKGKSMLFGMVMLAILLSLTPVMSYLASILPNSLVATVYFVPIAACMAVYYIMSYVVPADIAQVDELVTGESRAGIYEGFKSLPLNLFQAAATLLLGWFMQFSVDFTGSELFGYLWWGPIFAPFLIIAAIILRGTDIDPKIESLISVAMESEEAVSE